MSEKIRRLALVIVLACFIVISLVVGGLVYQSVFLVPDEPTLSCTEQNLTPDEYINYGSLSDSKQELVKRELSGKIVYLNDSEDRFFSSRRIIVHKGQTYNCVAVHR